MLNFFLSQFAIAIDRNALRLRLGITFDIVSSLLVDFIPKID